MASMLVPMIGPVGLGDARVELVEEEMVVLRLVERIAQLEAKLYKRENDSPADQGTLTGRFQALMQAARTGVDAGFSYM